MLLQAVAFTVASEQKVLGNDESNEALTTPDVAAEPDYVQSGWSPYQNGKDHGRVSPQENR